jgi:hypothetical protein
VAAAVQGLAGLDAGRLDGQREWRRAEDTLKTSGSRYVSSWPRQVRRGRADAIIDKTNALLENVGVGGRVGVMFCRRANSGLGTERVRLDERTGGLWGGGTRKEELAEAG